MLTLFLTDIGQEIELVDETVKYTKQCNDIADLSSREVNYTDSFNAPKNAQNTYVFNQLGLAGDISALPYQKVKASLLDNGIPLVKDGWLNIKETSKDYKLHIYDGIIDLFKAIENKTFGDDVDLSEINHNKNLTTVLASFTNPNYRYIVNDYGGKTHLTNKNINIDYLVPSVSWSYLWNKIFSTFGFVSLGNFLQSDDFTGLWLTFPKGIASNSVPVLYANFTNYNYGTNTYGTINIVNGLNIGNNTYKVTETGTYLVTVNGVGTVTGIFFTTTSAKFGFFVNGVLINIFNNATSFTYQLSINDTAHVSILLDVVYYPNVFLGNAIIQSTVQSQEMKFERYSTLISFSEELKNLKITDFFKEVLWRFGLTIFIDEDGNYVFKTFDERLEADVINWSEKYVERTPETYTPKSYAQKNNFTEKYNDENAEFYRIKYSEVEALVFLIIVSNTGGNFFISNFNDYIKTQIIIDNITNQTSTVVNYSNPIVTAGYASGTQIRLRDIDTQTIISNIYQVP